MNLNEKTVGKLPHDDQISTSHARILVVDDQASNVQMVGLILGTLGNEIIPASDGPTALKRVAAHVPDLILLDLLMPGMSGRDVCLQLKRHPEWRDIPVIFLSAADDKDLIVSALDAGGVDYITNPLIRLNLSPAFAPSLPSRPPATGLKNSPKIKTNYSAYLPTI